MALALYHAFNAEMQPGEYSQDLHMTAISIYRQSRTKFPTGSPEELASEVSAALERGWL